MSPLKTEHFQGYIMHVAPSALKSKSVECPHNYEDPTGYLLKWHLHRGYMNRKHQCTIFSHDCTAISGKCFFPQIVLLSEVRWAHSKRSHNQHHTVHPNDHHSVLALLHLNAYMLSCFPGQCVGFYGYHGGSTMKILLIEQGPNW